MLKPDIFEELLATYPAEKRELARQAYYRFAGGDNTQFFTQLFLLLDVYAHYAERVPQAVMEANQNAHAGLVKVREEIGLLAQTIDKRDLNITNHAEKTEELCQAAVAKCNETLARFEAVLKSVGTHIDTKAIVAGIEQTVQDNLRRDVISPFMRRTAELAEKVVPTLQEIRDTAGEVNRLCPKRIWTSAMIGSFSLALTLTLLVSVGIYVKFRNYAEKSAAERIADVARIMSANQDAFRQLAVAQVNVKVVRTGDTNGVRFPSGFALMVENADSAEMRPTEGRTNGVIFFSSHASETMIQTGAGRTPKTDEFNDRQGKMIWSPPAGTPKRLRYAFRVLVSRPRYSPTRPGIALRLRCSAPSARSGLVRASIIAR